MSLMFSKMHGLGNDFMVIDGITQEVTLEPERIRAWSDRHFGIGFDQLLLVEPPGSPVVDFRYRVFNADGSEVSQCGNGARCFAVFVRRKGLTSERRIRVETAEGRMVLTVLPNEEVEVDMGVPRLAPEQIPLQLPKGVTAETTHLSLPLLSGERLDTVALSMGNPHVVSFHDELTDALVATLGPELETHPWFPERANAGFLQVLDRETARLRVYERGAGETLACGSGACAAFVAAVLRGRMAPRATLHLTGGALTLGWDGPGTPVMMTGPATHVFDGTLEEGSDVL